jgi:hypothetical protein
MAGIALKPLTVSFHEYGFNAKLNSENRFEPWFMLSNTEKQQLGSTMGPVNPQALNRYAYVMNNPVKYVDPSGHGTECVAQGNCAVVHNDSYYPVYVTGDRPCASCPSGYETVTVRVDPGRSSQDYGIADADYVSAYDDAHRIDGHGTNEGYHPVSGETVHIVSDYCDGSPADCASGGGSRRHDGEQRIESDGGFLRKVYGRTIGQLTGQRAGWVPSTDYHHGRIIDPPPKANKPHST